MSPSKLVFYKAKVISTSLICPHELVEMTVRDESSKAHPDYLISEEMALLAPNHSGVRAIAISIYSTSLHWLELDRVGLSDPSSSRETGAMSDGLEHDRRASRLFNLGRTAAILLIKSSQFNDCEMNLAFITSIISERYLALQQGFKLKAIRFKNTYKDN